MLRTGTLLKRIYTAGFLLSFQIALTIYVNSSFLATKIPENLVGLLYTASAVISIIGLFIVPKIIPVLGTKKILIGLIIANIINIGAMVFGIGSLIPSIGFILFFAFNTLLYMTLDIVIEHHTTKQNEGRVRGAYLTAMSLGFVVAPILAGFITERLGFEALYLLGIMLLVPLIILATLFLPNIITTHPAQGNILGLTRKFIKNSHLRGVFGINFLLQFFYAWMVIYTPIYLHEYINLSWETIGILFTIMLCAFVVFQYITGFIADRFHIEKHLMSLGLLIMGITTIFMSHITGASLFIIGTLLFSTRIGASIVEVSSESYFFKHIDRQDVGSIGFFRNTYPFAYIIAPLLATALIQKLPLVVLFPILGWVCIIMALLVIWVGHLVPKKKHL